MTSVERVPDQRPGRGWRSRSGAALVRGEARTPPEHEDPGGAWYRFGGETWLYLYATPSAGTAKNTIAGWEVKDIESSWPVSAMRGVVFEQYDLGDVQMVDGLADFGEAKAAWFKDSEGNTYELTEVLRATLDMRATPRFAAPMKIGELAESRWGLDRHVRFYERSGWLPRAPDEPTPTASTASRMSSTCACSSICVGSMSR